MNLRCAKLCGVTLVLLLFQGCVVLRRVNEDPVEYTQRIDAPDEFRILLSIEGHGAKDEDAPKPRFGPSELERLAKKTGNCLNGAGYSFSFVDREADAHVRVSLERNGEISPAAEMHFEISAATLFLVPCWGTMSDAVVYEFTDVETGHARTTTVDDIFICQLFLVYVSPINLFTVFNSYPGYEKSLLRFMESTYAKQVKDQEDQSQRIEVSPLIGPFEPSVVATNH